MESTLKRIKEKSANGILLGLDSIKALCQVLENPQNDFDCVHIAGTNGKGSVCAFCESVLTRADIKVGCYTSPAVFEKLEQFRIDGINVSQDYFINAANEVLNAVDIVNQNGIYISEFEIETAIAFVLFKKAGCRICIIECGMGGKGDATNIIKNTLVAAFTPIDCEHQTFLGDNIYDIAKNKSGIIKPNCKVISAQQIHDAQNAIIEKCKDYNITPEFVDNSRIDIKDINSNGTEFTFENEEYIARLLGIHQAQNAALVIKICKALKNKGLDIEKHHIYQGILNAKNNGRFEIINTKPLIVLDGAHNSHAAKALKNTLNNFDKSYPFTIIMGVFADKDYNAILSELNKCSDTLIAVTPNNARALDAKLLCETAKQYFTNISVATIYEAAQFCRQHTEKSYCVCGSLSYLNEFKENYMQYQGE